MFTVEQAIKALDWEGVQSHASAALSPQKKNGTHCTGAWVGLKADLDRCGKSHLHRDSIPGRSAGSESFYRLRYPEQLVRSYKGIRVSETIPITYLLDTIFSSLFMNHHFGFFD
jgi:hypothetical protein